MRKTWLAFCQLFTILFLAWYTTHLARLPVFESNGTTLLHADQKTQQAVAEALSVPLGDPGVTLDTPDIKRYLFEDGTSVDALSARAAKEAPYPVVALKQIALPIFSHRTPQTVASEMRSVLQQNGFANSLVLAQPDPAIAAGDIVILFSDAFRNQTGSGYAVLVRKNALRINGPRPTRFHSWQ